MSERPLLLACEDEERIAELLRTIAEPLGVDFIAARDGATALAHLAARKPSIMTLDLVLRNLDGFAVLERIRQRRDLDDMPVLIVSGTCDPATIKRAYALGAIDFVAKPFNIDLLEAKLRVFLRMRKLTEELRRQHTLVEQVVDRLASGLIVVDSERLIVKVNATACATLGLPTESLLGRPVAEALPGAESMFQVAGDGAQRRATVQTAQGARLLGFSNSTVEIDGAAGAAAVFRELSEVESARREREERGRRESLAASARSFAHEVRNPLTAIGAAAQVIVRSDCGDERRVRMARAIESEAARVAGLVTEYVDQQAPPLRPGPVDIPMLLAELVEVNLLNSPARARVQVACNAPVPHAYADGPRLKQVLLNLVLNAIQATEEAGRVVLDAVVDAGGVAVKVCDTGCGIAAADLPRIFEETFSTRKGGGLGLPIARRIVEAQGGAIRVESAPGRGAAFTVWLPSAWPERS